MGQVKDQLGGYPTSIGENMGMMNDHEWAQKQRYAQQKMEEVKAHMKLQQLQLQQAQLMAQSSPYAQSGLYNQGLSGLTGLGGVGGVPTYTGTTTTTAGTCSITVTPGGVTSYDPNSGMITFYPEDGGLVAATPAPEPVKEKSFAEKVEDEVNEFLKR